MASGVVKLDERSKPEQVELIGFSAPEPEGIWTAGPRAAITFRIVPERHTDIDIRLELRPFVVRKSLPRQELSVISGGRELARWSIGEQGFRTRRLIIPSSCVDDDGLIRLELAIPTCTQPSALGVNSDGRQLGVMLRRLAWTPVRDGSGDDDQFMSQLGRPVGIEARKSFDQRVETGFWSRFITGPNVLDIGFRGDPLGGETVPIVEGAIGIDLDYPGYDGRTLPFPDESQDAVFSSHCLEHIPDHINTIQEWYRVTRNSGHIITAVPSAYLYERARRPPSRWNPDHRRFYTPASLLAEFETALRPNTYRVRLLEDNDAGYRYDGDPNAHPAGCYEIVLVIQKIQPPAWQLRD